MMIIIIIMIMIIDVGGVVLIAVDMMDARHYTALCCLMREWRRTMIVLTMSILTTLL